MVERHRTQVAVLASGGGTTAEALIHATHDGRVKNAEVSLVVCNNPRERAGIWGRVDRLNQRYGSEIEIVQMNSIMYPGGSAEREQIRDCAAADVQQQRPRAAQARQGCGQNEGVAP